MAAHLATATEVLACAERTEAEARAGDDRILDAASAALREAIEHGRDIAGIADPRLPDKLQLDDAVAGRGIAERTVADIEAAHASAVRLVARRKAAVDAAEVALVVDIAIVKAAEVEALRAQIEPLLDWLEAMAVLRVRGPGGLAPDHLAGRGSPRVDPGRSGAARPAAAVARLRLARRGDRGRRIAEAPGWGSRGASPHAVQPIRGNIRP